MVINILELDKNSLETFLKPLYVIKEKYIDKEDDILTKLNALGCDEITNQYDVIYITLDNISDIEFKESINKDSKWRNISLN